MKKINPYLNFPGTTEEAFNFYKSVFGGEFLMIMRFGETPDADKMPDEIKDKIMHVSLPIGNGNILMGTDAMEELGHKITVGTNFHLTVHTESKEEADKLYSALSINGKIAQPMADQFWGDYFGMLTDKFGIQWMISFNQNRA